MNLAGRDVVGRLRRPEYTGENRCIPCTVANVAIAVVGSSALGYVSPPLGALSLAGSLAAIYLRGYLVPGTPELTKRYFPDRVLRYFDKEATPTRPPADDEGETVDPETVLGDADILEPCAGNDLCLTAEFDEAWRAGVESIRTEETGEKRLAAILGANPDALAIKDYDEARVARLDGQVLAQWESEAALLADLAAEPLLADRYDRWADLSMESRGRALISLRIFLERCPACDGPVSLAEESVDSCCRSIDVVAANCEGCGARLLELEDLGV